MKTITTIKNYKREDFQKDFRLRIMYTAILDSPIIQTDELNIILEELGFDKKTDSLYADFDREIYVYRDGNKLTVCFERNLGYFHNRLNVTNEIFNIVFSKLGLRVTALSVVHLNRYVLSNFTNSEGEKKRALEFFFTKEFATEEEIIYKEENMLAYSQATFVINAQDSCDLDFSIFVCRILNSLEQIDFFKLFEDIDTLSYKYWRSATPKGIIDEMKRKNDE